MRFIPEEIVDRLENEWRQITKSTGEAKAELVFPIHPTDQIRKMAALAIAHSGRKKL